MRFSIFNWFCFFFFFWVFISLAEILEAQEILIWVFLFRVQYIDSLHASMAEVDPMIVDSVDRSKPMTDGPVQKKKALKRKRVDPSLSTTSPEEKNAKITQFRCEIDSLVKFCKDLVQENRGTLLEHAEKVGISSASLNGVIACLLEESDLSLSKLVDEIFEKVKGGIGNGDVVTKASVKNSVLIIGQRVCYGVTNADADILEDEAHCALWCWEVQILVNHCYCSY